MIFITELDDPRLKRVSTETYRETVVRVSMIKLILERDRAIKALTNAGFKDLGGEAWKPPVNEYATLYHTNRREFETLVHEILAAVNKAVTTDEDLTDEYVETMGHELR